MYQDRIRDHEDSKLAARRYVGQLLDINPATLRNWVEREEVDAGQRPGVPTDLDQELRRLQRENAELRRANEILKTASAYFAAAELDRRFRSS
jgi:transposase-like protein